MTKRLTCGEAAGCIAKDRLSRAAKRQQLERIVGPPPRSSPLYGHGSAGHGAMVLQVEPRRAVEQTTWQAVPAMWFVERSGVGLNALLGFTPVALGNARGILALPLRSRPPTPTPAQGRPQFRGAWPPQALLIGTSPWG